MPFQKCDTPHARTGIFQALSLLATLPRIPRAAGRPIADRPQILLFRIDVRERPLIVDCDVAGRRCMCADDRLGALGRTSGTKLVEQRSINEQRMAVTAA